MERRRRPLPACARRAARVHPPRPPATPRSPRSPPRPAPLRPGTPPAAPDLEAFGRRGGETSSATHALDAAPRSTRAAIARPETGRSGCPATSTSPSRTSAGQRRVQVPPRVRRNHLRHRPNTRSGGATARSRRSARCAPNRQAPARGRPASATSLCLCHPGGHRRLGHRQRRAQVLRARGLSVAPGNLRRVLEIIDSPRPSRPWFDLLV